MVKTRAERRRREAEARAQAQSEAEKREVWYPMLYPKAVHPRLLVDTAVTDDDTVAFESPPGSPRGPQYSPHSPSYEPRFSDTGERG
jgi:hypothetical protein